MGDSFDLKKISKEGVSRALERAEHYRLLNDPGEAESACLDVLDVDPDNQRALVNLVLSLSDQFSLVTGAISRAREAIRKVRDEYQREYYTALVCEREARAFLGREAREAAYESLRDAMDHYEKAAPQREAGNDDPILRYNSCLRTIRRYHLEPPVPQRELPLE
jgi:hypothetical protein